MDATVVPKFVLVDAHLRQLPDRMVGGVSHFTDQPEYAALGAEQRHRPDAR
ncbi:MAG: hypothetical protein V3R98_06885 [Alphaproteobacteria bacterium]